MTTNGKCLNWLYRQIRKSRIDLAHAESRNDTGAADKLREKIDILDRLIQLVPEED